MGTLAERKLALYLALSAARRETAALLLARS
jgi:hypothetical protein